MVQRPLFESDLDWRPSTRSESLLLSRFGEVAILRLYRPQVKNALSAELFTSIVEEAERFDADDAIAAIVLTGGGKVFAAGADIREFSGKSALEMHGLPRLEEWRRLRRIRKPLLAAVNGFALGGGCELAMVCDIIIAGESAVFGQPEIDLGLIPGGGATQRLIRAVGKSVAMDMILTGRRLTAPEALGHGLVSRVVPDELALDIAVQIGEDIASKPLAAIASAKEAVLLAENAAIVEGIEQERRLFEALFSTPETQQRFSGFNEKRSRQSGRDSA